MVDIEYYKDFRHNYIILKVLDLTVDMYQCKMITGNKIDGLLPCQERHINGDMLLYYEITSKQSFANLYENRRINFRLLSKFFVQLKMVWENLSRYLLDEKNLLLNPEYIYVDVETQELFFIYYPCETGDKYIASLLEFLMDKVDNEDCEAVEITYKMYELVEKEQFVLDEVLQWFEQVYEVSAESNKGQDDENMCKKNFPEEEAEEENPEVSENSGNLNRLSGKAALVSLFAGSITAGVLCYLLYSYQLTEREMVYCYAGMFMAGVLLLAGGLGLIYMRCGKKISFLENRAETVKKRMSEDIEKPFQETMVCEKVQEKLNESYGNTVFIPWVESSENKLYGMGKGNKNHIDLSRLPITVGKLAGSVDMVIADQSISRRHVKFSREGDRIYMTDLNSTNGTFRNGLRLEPNTSEVLEPGDEIKLGKLKFIYR